MRLDIPTMIVSSIAAGLLAVTITLLLVLATGAEWSQRTPDDYDFFKRCYELNERFFDTSEDSVEEELALDRIFDSSCWP